MSLSKRLFDDLQRRDPLVGEMPWDYQEANRVLEFLYGRSEDSPWPSPEELEADNENHK